MLTGFSFYSSHFPDSIEKECPLRTFYHKAKFHTVLMYSAFRIIFHHLTAIMHKDKTFVIMLCSSS
ncbi:hypothetical protein A361_20275 [Cytobacillus oceanisediminis 2691]|uniref:Uncharacterized protein n=1 Tax=Cytobacillus oceanisediminis 2691 TaxID=1196031 RepID=A0A160ME65_9BACI|nr:hypothetical protein A361_20275 [Cytobacillus oceanisediminis 2691]